MITRPLSKLARISIIQNATATKPSQPTRHFSTSKQTQGQNRIYTPVRTPTDFQTYLSHSNSTRVPLLTLWTSSYTSTSSSQTCTLITSLLHSGVGEVEGGVAFCEVEYDAPDIMDAGLGSVYMISKLPTLLAFDRGEAMTGTVVVEEGRLRDEGFLGEWIRNEARRRGEGGGGSGSLGFGNGDGKGIFGGLFGVRR